MKLFRENTPLTDNDCFMIFSRKKSGFDFPLHTHTEMELNLILNAAGASRVIGNHVGTIDDMELVLVSGDTPHTWMTDRCQSKEIHEITIQFHPNLLGERLMSCNVTTSLRRLFEDAHRGVLFPRETIERVAPRIRQLFEGGGDSDLQPLLGLLMILNDLSLCRERMLLSDATFTNPHQAAHSARLETAFAWMNQNFNRPITLSDVAAVVNMSDVVFSRFIKKSTGQSFIDSLAEIRLGHVTRLLLDSDMTISEIAYSCGFNNMANFNRIFKRKKGMPPREFRIRYVPAKKFV